MLRDGYQNLAAGLGVGKSKRDFGRFNLGFVNDYFELEAAFQESWIAQGICTIPAQDSTRNWRTIKSDGAEEIKALEDDLCVKSKVKDLITWSRLYGGAGIVMVTNQDLTKPLNIDRVKKGSLKNLMVFDRWDLVPELYNTVNILDPNYLNPDYYTVRGGITRIHHSHIVRLEGIKLPLRRMIETQGWGDSVLRRCLDVIKDYSGALAGIAELMQEANVDVIKRESLQEEITTDQEPEIIKRYELFSLMKSISNLALLDDGETYDRKTLALSGVAQTIEQLITNVAGAAGMPVTLVFGTSAKGMNATGEGDMRNHYDSISAFQNSDLQMAMRKLDQVLVRSALGSFPKSFDYVWNTLEQLDDEKEQRAKLTAAQRDDIYLNAGVVTTSQIRRNLQSSEDYQFDDDALSALESLEDENLFALSKMEPVDGGDDEKKPDENVS